MKRTKPGTTQSSTAAMISAGVILATGAGAQQPVTRPATAPATAASAARAPRNTMHIKYSEKYIKYGENLTVAGMSAGSPVFKTAQGEFFQVDPATGDMQFLTAASLGYHKGTTPTVRAAAAHNDYIKFDGIKGTAKVALAGVDDQGHVIQANSRGEKFYLSPAGDMVFVK